MESWTTDFIDKMQSEINATLSTTLGVDVRECSGQDKIECTKLHSTFKLPIEYVNSDELHPLSEVVTQDLELVKEDGELSVYERLFQPTNILGHNMIDDWKKQFT